MNRYKVLIAGLLALAGVLLYLALRPSTPVASEKGPALASEGKRHAAAAKTAAKAEPTKNTAQAKASRKTSPMTQSAEAERPAVNPGETQQAAAAPEAKTPREKAVDAWESLVDQVIEQKDLPAADQAKRVKEAFDKLDKADQMDGIHRSLNLFPDEQFPALYAILYDKTENAEVLDAIFSDALNRPEEIKNPLMKDLRKDREHPMYFESARILDVVEPEEEKAPQP